MNSSRLLTLSRDIRVTRRRYRACSTRRRRSSFAAFVAGILARHARGVVTLFGPDRVARRPPLPVPAVHQHRNDATRLVLHFNLRLAPTLRTRTQSAPFLPWRAPRGDAVSPTRAAGLSLVQRIVARERRVEIATTMRDVLRGLVAAERAGAPPPARARPVEMVARRPHVPVPEAARAAPRVVPAREADARDARVTPLRSAAVDAPVPLGAAELGRITDHVVRAIDQRFIAQRERRGRI